MIENMLKGSGISYSNDLANSDLDTFTPNKVLIFLPIFEYGVKKEEYDKLPLVPAYDEKSSDDKILCYTNVYVGNETLTAPIYEREKEEPGDEGLRLSDSGSNGEIENQIEENDFNLHFSDGYMPFNFIPSIMKIRNAIYRKIKESSFFGKMHGFFGKMHGFFGKMYDPDYDGAKARTPDYQGRGDSEDNPKKPLKYEIPKDIKPKSLLKIIERFIKKNAPEEPEEPPEIATDKVVKFEHLSKQPEKDRDLELRLVA